MDNFPWEDFDSVLQDADSRGLSLNTDEEIKKYIKDRALRQEVEEEVNRAISDKVFEYDELFDLIKRGQELSSTPDGIAHIIEKDGNIVLNADDFLNPVTTSISSGNTLRVTHLGDGSLIFEDSAHGERVLLGAGNPDLLTAMGRVVPGVGDASGHDVSLHNKLIEVNKLLEDVDSSLGIRTRGKSATDIRLQHMAEQDLIAWKDAMIAGEAAEGHTVDVLEQSNLERLREILLKDRNITEEQLAKLKDPLSNVTHVLLPSTNAQDARALHHVFRANPNVKIFMDPDSIPAAMQSLRGRKTAIAKTIDLIKESGGDIIEMINKEMITTGRFEILPVTVSRDRSAVYGFVVRHVPTNSRILYLPASQDREAVKYMLSQGPIDAMWLDASNDGVVLSGVVPPGYREKFNRYLRIEEEVFDDIAAAVEKTNAPPSYVELMNIGHNITSKDRAEELALRIDPGGKLSRVQLSYPGKSVVNPMFVAHELPTAQKTTVSVNGAQTNEEIHNNISQRLARESSRRVTGAASAEDEAEAMVYAKSKIGQAAVDSTEKFSAADYAETDIVGTMNAAGVQGDASDILEMDQVGSEFKDFIDINTREINAFSNKKVVNRAVLEKFNIDLFTPKVDMDRLVSDQAYFDEVFKEAIPKGHTNRISARIELKDLWHRFNWGTIQQTEIFDPFDALQIDLRIADLPIEHRLAHQWAHVYSKLRAIDKSILEKVHIRDFSGLRAINTGSYADGPGRQKLTRRMLEKVVARNRKIDRYFKEQFLDKYMFMSGIVSGDIADPAVGRLLSDEDKFIELLRNEDPVLFRSDSYARDTYAKLRSARDTKIANNTVADWVRESQRTIDEVITNSAAKLKKPTNVIAWSDVNKLFSEKLVTEDKLSLSVFESSVYTYINRAKQLTLIEDVRDMFDDARRINLLTEKAKGLLEELAKQTDLTTEYAKVLLKDLDSTMGMLSGANFVHLERPPKFSDYSSWLAASEAEARRIIYREFNKIAGRGALFLPGATASDRDRAIKLLEEFEGWRKNFHRDALPTEAGSGIGKIFDEFHRIKLKEFGARLEKEKSHVVLNEAVNFFASRLGYVPTEEQVDVLSSLHSPLDLQRHAQTPEERNIVKVLNSRYNVMKRKYPIVSAKDIDTTSMSPEVERFVELRRQKDGLLHNLRLKQEEVRSMPKKLNTLFVNLQQEAYGSITGPIDPDELDVLTAGDQRIRALRNKRLALDNEVADIRIQISRIDAEILKHRLANTEAYASASDIMQNIGRNKNIPIHIREDMEGILLRLDNINLERAKLYNGYNEILRLRTEFEQTLSAVEKQKIHKQMVKVFDELIPLTDAGVYMNKIAPYVLNRLQTDALDIGGLQKHMEILESAVQDRLKDVDGELNKLSGISRRVIAFAGSKVRVPVFQILRDTYSSDVARTKLGHYMLFPQDVIRVNMFELPKIWNAGLGGAAQGMHIDLMRKYGFNYTPGNVTSAYLFPIRDARNKLAYKLNISANMSPEMINNLILHAEQIALSNGVENVVVEMPANIARNAMNYTEESHGILLKYLRSNQNPLAGEHYGVGNNGLFKYRTFSSMAAVDTEVSAILNKIKHVQMASPSEVYKITAFAEPAVEMIGTPVQYSMFRSELNGYLNDKGVGSLSTSGVDDISKNILDEITQAMSGRIDAESRIHAPMSRVWGRNGEFPLLVYVDKADNIKVANLGIKIKPDKLDIVTDVILRSGKGFLPSDGKYSLIVARSQTGQYIVTGVAGKLPDNVPFQAVQHTINFLISNDARSEHFDGLIQVEQDIVKAQAEMERRIRNIQIDPDELAGFMLEEAKLRTQYILDVENAVGDKTLIANAEQSFNEAVSALYRGKVYGKDGAVDTKWMRLASIRNEYLGIKNRTIFGVTAYEDGAITVLNKYAGGFGATVYFDQGVPVSNISSQYIEERLTQLRNQLSTNPARTAEISEEMARLRAIKTLTINPETRISIISPQVSYEQDKLIYQNIITNDMPAAVLAKDEARIDRLNYILGVLENNMEREDRMRKMFRLLDDDTMTMSQLVDIRGRFLLSDRLKELRQMKASKTLTPETEEELKRLEQAYNFVYNLKYRRTQTISNINRETQLIADGMPFADWFKMRWEVIDRMARSYVGRGADSIGRILPRARDIYHNIIGIDANYISMYEELDMAKNELANLKKDISFQESEYKRKLTESGLKPLSKELDQLQDRLKVVNDSIMGLDAQYWQGPISTGRVVDDAQSIIDHLVVKKLPIKNAQHAEVRALLDGYIGELNKEYTDLWNKIAFSTENFEINKERAEIIMNEIDTIKHIRDNIFNINKLNETFTSQRLGMPSLLLQKKGIEARIVTLGVELGNRYPQEVSIQLQQLSLLKSRRQSLLERVSIIESRIEALPPDIRSRFGRLYEIKFGPLSKIDKLQAELETLTSTAKTLVVQPDIDDINKKISTIRGEISNIQGQMSKDVAEIRRIETELRTEVNIYDDMATVNSKYFTERKAAAEDELAKIKDVILKKRSAGQNVARELAKKIDLEKRVQALNAGAKSVGSMQDRLDLARLRAAAEHNRLRDHLTYPQALRNELWRSEYRRLESSVSKLYNEVYELENILSVIDPAYSVHALQRDGQQFVKLFKNALDVIAKGARANVHEARQRQIDLAMMKYGNEVLYRRVQGMRYARERYAKILSPGKDEKILDPRAAEALIKEIYDEMLKLSDFSTIYIPESGATFLHPETGIAFRAAVRARLDPKGIGLSAAMTADIAADPSKAHSLAVAAEELKMEFLAKDLARFVEDSGIKLTDIERSSLVDRISAVMSVHNKSFSEKVWSKVRHERMLIEGLNINKLIGSLDGLYDRMANSKLTIEVAEAEIERLFDTLPEDAIEVVTKEIRTKLDNIDNLRLRILRSTDEYNRIKKITAAIEKVKARVNKEPLENIISAILDEHFRDRDVLEYLNLHAMDKIVKNEAEMLKMVANELDGLPFPFYVSQMKFFDAFRASMYALDPEIMLPKHTIYYKIIEKIMKEANASVSAEDMSRLAKELNKVFEGWGIDILSMYKLPGSLKGDGIQYELVQVLVNDRYFMTKLAKAATRANFSVDRSATEVANVLNSYTKQMWPADMFPSLLDTIDSMVSSFIKGIYHGQITLPGVTVSVGLTDIEREEFRQLENKRITQPLSVAELSRYEDLKAWDKTRKRPHIADDAVDVLKTYLLEDGRIVVVRNDMTYEKVWGLKDKELRVLKVLRNPLNKYNKGAHVDFHALAGEISKLKSTKEADNRLIAANIYEILLKDSGVVIKPEHRGNLQEILTNYRDDILKLRPPQFDPSNIPKTFVTEDGRVVSGIMRQHKDWVKPQILLDEIGSWTSPYDNFKTFLVKQGVNWEIFGDSAEWFGRYQKEIVAFHKVMEQIREKDTLLYSYEAEVLAHIFNNRAVPLGANPKSIALYLVSLVERRTQAIKDMVLADKRAIERISIRRTEIVPKDTPQLAMSRAQEVLSALQDDLNKQRKFLVNLNRPFKQQVVSRIEGTAGLAEDATKLLRLSADQLAIIDELEFLFRQTKIMRTPGTWRLKYGKKTIDLLAKLDEISGTGYAKYINSQYHNMIRVNGLDWDIDEILGIWWKKNKGYIPKELRTEIDELMKANMRGSERASAVFKIIDGQVSDWTTHMRATKDVVMKAHYVDRIKELNEVLNSRIVGGRWYKETLRHFYELIPGLEITDQKALDILNKVQDEHPPVEEIRALLDDLVNTFKGKPNKLAVLDEMRLAFEEMQLSNRGMIWSIIDTISVMTSQAVPDDETLSRGMSHLSAYTSVKPEELEARFGHKIYRIPDFETEIKFPTVVSEDKDAIIARLFAGIKEREKLISQLPVGELEYTDKQVMDMLEALGELEVRKLGIRYKHDLDVYLAVEQILSQYQFDSQAPDAAQQLRTILNRAVKKNELSRDEVRKYYKVRGYMFLGKITPEDLVEYEAMLPIYQRQMRLAHLRMQISRDMAELHAIRSLSTYSVIDQTKKNIEAIESQMKDIREYDNAIRTYNSSIKSRTIASRGITYRTDKNLLRRLALTNEVDTNYAIMNDDRLAIINDILEHIDKRARQVYIGPEEAIGGRIAEMMGAGSARVYLAVEQILSQHQFDPQAPDAAQQLRLILDRAVKNNELSHDEVRMYNKIRRDMFFGQVVPEEWVSITDPKIRNKIFEAVHTAYYPHIISDIDLRKAKQDEAATVLRDTLTTRAEKNAFDVGFSFYREYFNEALVVANHGRKINEITHTLDASANDIFQKLSSTMIKEDILPPAYWDSIKRTRQVLDKWYKNMHFTIQDTQMKASTILNAVARDLNINSGYEISSWIRKYGKIGIKVAEAAVGLDSLNNNLKKMARGIKYSAKDAIADQMKLFFGSEALRAFHGFNGMIHTLTYWTHKTNAESTYYMFRNMGKELEPLVPWNTGEEMGVGRALSGIRDLGTKWYESNYGKRGNALYNTLEKSIDSAGKEAKRRLQQGVHPILVGQQMMGDVGNAYIDARQGAENLIGDAGIDSANQVMAGAYGDNAAIISKIEYKAVSDSRTCSFCRSNDGVMYDPADNRPPLPRHPNCRCWYRQWLKTPDQISTTLEQEAPERKRKYDVWLDVDPDSLGGMGAGLRKLKRPLRPDGTISDDDWLDWYNQQPYDIRKRMVGEENALAAALGIYGDDEPTSKHKFVKSAAAGIMGDLIRRTGYNTSIQLIQNIFRDRGVQTNILRAFYDKKNAAKYVKSINWKALFSGPDNIVQPSIKQGFSNAVGVMASSNPNNPGELEMLINKYVSPQLFNMAIRVAESKHVPTWLRQYVGPLRQAMDDWGKGKTTTSEMHKNILNLNQEKNKNLSIGFMRLVEPWAQMISEVYWPSLNMHQVKVEQAAEEAIKMAETGTAEAVIQSVARAFKNSGVVDVDIEMAMKRFADSLPLGEKEELTKILNTLTRERVPSSTQRDIIEIRGILRGSRGKSVKEILNTPEIKEKFLSLSASERHLLADTIENAERRAALLEFGTLASEPGGGELLSTLIIRDPIGSTTQGGIANRYIIGPDGRIYSDNKDMVLSASRLVNPEFKDSDFIRISISRTGDDAYVFNLLNRTFDMNNKNSVVSGLRSLIYRAGGGSKTPNWVNELLQVGTVVIRKGNLGPSTMTQITAPIKYVDTAIDNIINMSIKELKARGAIINPGDDALRGEVFKYIVSNMRSWVEGLPPAFRKDVSNAIRYRLYGYGTTGVPSQSMLDRIAIMLGQNM